MSMSTLPYPDENQASQFAVMLEAGLTATQAILYFIESDDPGYLGQVAARWTRARTVQKAQQALLDKSWAAMSTDERMKVALDRHYSQLATILFSTHYAEANPQEKGKMDEARKALESKVAGTAGKGDPFSRFMDDLNTGKLKLAARIQ